MLNDDTICALSSSALVARRAVVRISGKRAWEMGGSLFEGGAFEPGQAVRGIVRLPVGEVPVWVYCFAGPRSYTGEDQLEFHLPGNPLLVHQLMRALTQAGARSAEPGEFTARAYFHGRLDLAAAEGVAAIVSAENEQQLQAGRQLLAGALAGRLRPIMDRVTETLALVEIGIDFSEEDVRIITVDELGQRVVGIELELRKLLEETRRFEVLAHQPTVVLVGRPNAGKSSLLNALARFERAVVSDVAGTTRDAVSAQVVLRSGRVRLIDVAGLDAPSGVLGGQMQDRAMQMVQQCDLVLLVVDITDENEAVTLPRPADMVVYSKVDLLEKSAGARNGMPYNGGCTGLDGWLVSSRTGQGLDELRDGLDKLAFTTRDGSGTLTLNQRHVAAIEAAQKTLQCLDVTLVDDMPELVATELRQVLDDLGTILGEVAPDEVLGEIFSHFCIGK